MSKVISKSISVARGELPALFAGVVSGEIDSVVIAHRDAADTAVLVSGSYLRHLKQLAGLEVAAAPGAFRLIGSATLHGDPDSVVDDARAAERVRDAGRRVGV